jgi:hypothetical protein
MLGFSDSLKYFYSSPLYCSLHTFDLVKKRIYLSFHFLLPVEANSGLSFKLSSRMYVCTYIRNRLLKRKPDIDRKYVFHVYQKTEVDYARIDLLEGEVGKKIVPFSFEKYLFIFLGNQVHTYIQSVHNT